MKRKIVAYTVLTKECVEELIMAVNNLIQDGWQPEGATQVTPSARGFWWYQTMVKVTYSI